jgi:hypothetical protein
MRCIVILVAAVLGLSGCERYPAHSGCKAGSEFDDCYDVQAPQRWKGVWVLGPAEHDERFCPGIGIRCDDAKEPHFNLVFNRGAFPSGPPAQTTGMYALDFIGRRTQNQDQYLEFAPRGYVIIVDRLTSIEEIEAPQNE